MCEVHLPKQLTNSVKQSFSVVGQWKSSAAKSGFTFPKAHSRASLQRVYGSIRFLPRSIGFSSSLRLPGHRPIRSETLLGCRGLQPSERTLNSLRSAEIASRTIFNLSVFASTLWHQSRSCRWIRSSAPTQSHCWEFRLPSPRTTAVMSINRN